MKWKLLHHHATKKVNWLSDPIWIFFASFEKQPIIECNESMSKRTRIKCIWIFPPNSTCFRNRIWSLFKLIWQLINLFVYFQRSKLDLHQIIRFKFSRLFSALWRHTFLKLHNSKTVNPIRKRKIYLESPNKEASFDILMWIFWHFNHRLLVWCS